MPHGGSELRIKYLRTYLQMLFCRKHSQFDEERQCIDLLFSNYIYSILVSDIFMVFLNIYSYLG